ncbi:MAG TPA: hypothetical protein VFJ78_04965 [Gaiellaceae bacterium]|nr:hypothetical protein [Gaiellaceae bacterium]
MALAPLLALLTLAAPLAAQQPQHPLVALRLDDPAYVQLSSLERMGCDEARVSPYRPYEVRRVREALDRAGTNARCAGPILDALRKRFAADTVAPLDTAGVAPDLAAAAAATAAMRGRPSRSGVDGAITLRLTGLGKGDFRPMWKGVQPTDSGTPPFVGVLRLRATVDGGDNLVAVVGGYAESNRRNDPRVRMKRLRKSEAVLDFDDAYITGKLGLATITLGRGSEAWLGEGDESIALSAHGPPLDRIAASAVWKRLEGRALVATINDVTLDLALDSLVGEPPAQRYRRVLLGHALTYRHSPRVEFTIGETALLARTNTIFDLAYANPLMPYVFTQNDTSRAGTEARDNLQVFAATRFPLGPARVTGELLVDDIQIDPADRAVTPDQLAWRLAASTPVPLARPASAGVEYRHVNSYTYLRGQYTEVYQSYDAPLGSELGPDADLLRASLDLWLGGTTRVSFGVGSWRQGALRIYQRPAQSANFNAGRPYPTTSAERPAVQRALLGDVAIQMLRTALPVSLRVETARVDNAANQFALPAMYVRAQLIGSYAFRYP